MSRRRLRQLESIGFIWDALRVKNRNKVVSMEEASSHMDGFDMSDAVDPVEDPVSISNTDNNVSSHQSQGGRQKVRGDGNSTAWSNNMRATSKCFLHAGGRGEVDAPGPAPLAGNAPDDTITEQEDGTSIMMPASTFFLGSGVPTDHNDTMMTMQEKEIGASGLTTGNTQVPLATQTRTAGAGNKEFPILHRMSSGGTIASLDGQTRSGNIPVLGAQGLLRKHTTRGYLGAVGNGRLLLDTEDQLPGDHDEFHNSLRVSSVPVVDNLLTTQMALTGSLSTVAVPSSSTALLRGDSQAQHDFVDVVDRRFLPQGSVSLSAAPILSPSTLGSLSYSASPFMGGNGSSLLVSPTGGGGRRLSSLHQPLAGMTQSLAGNDQLGYLLGNKLLSGSSYRDRCQSILL
mmetsp:Transcript_22889/g.53013  ORF Transcript_22889/g.53013 Transcript_22889/m.53013 type:complete len:401 (-) Transcript_22889:312-1514(-)